MGNNQSHKIYGTRENNNDTNQNIPDFNQ